MFKWTLVLKLMRLRVLYIAEKVHMSESAMSDAKQKSSNKLVAFVALAPELSATRGKHSKSALLR